MYQSLAIRRRTALFACQVNANPVSGAATEKHLMAARNAPGKACMVVTFARYISAKANVTPSTIPTWIYDIR
uniref:Uncharacterized protein n=1 Tax=Arion vulgaris TaxID=1028688 RepID=A0A0B7BR14_9EUPU